MKHLREIIKFNGDVLLTRDDEYINQKTRLRLICCRLNGCNEEYEITAQKIKFGQLHGCDKFVRALTTKKLKLTKNLL